MTRRPAWSPQGHHAGEPLVAQREHGRLFAAIRAARPVAARRVATEHLLSSAARLGLLGRRRRPGG